MANPIHLIKTWDSEANSFVLYCQSLDLSSYGETIEMAIEMMLFQLKQELNQNEFDLIITDGNILQPFPCSCNLFVNLSLSYFIIIIQSSL